LNADRVKYAGFAVIAASVVLSGIQFLYNRSLWLDEALIALNILERGHLELLKPLDFKQVAPILYLQLTKLASGITPFAEFGLRLVPLICFWASLFVFYKALRLLFRENFPVVFSLSLFAFNMHLLYYSSEVKQYMSDVFVSVMMMYLLLHAFRNPAARFFVLGAAGIIAIFLSNIAPIVLLASGLFLLFENKPWKNLHVLRLITLTGIAWLVTFLVYYLLFVHDHPSRAFMVAEWTKENAFLPVQVFSSGFFLFLKEKAGGIGNLVFSEYRVLIVLFLALILYGLWHLYKQGKGGLLFLFLAPVPVHLALSALQLYPFSSRLILYIIPFMIVPAIIGLQAVLEPIPAKGKRAIAGVGIFLVPGLLILNILTGDFPRERQEIKQILAFIGEKSPGPAYLCMNRGTWPAFDYYSKTGLVDPVSYRGIVVGSWEWADDEAFFREMTNLEDGFWLMLTDFREYDQDAFADRLLEAGYTQDHKFMATGCHAWYFSKTKESP
jgi:hypothetical protein